MAEDRGSKEDKYAAQLKESVEQLRGNVKWTLLAFGAIGTTLLAGSQLSNLGKFQYGDLRLWVALGFALMALGAAAFAVNAALKVAYTGHVDIDDLDDDDHAYIRRSTGLLAGYDSAEQIKLQYVDRVNKRFAHLNEGASLETLEIDDATLAFLEELIDTILSYVRYNRIMRASQDARRKLFGSSIIAAIGLVGFAWAANPATEQQTIVLQSPTSPAKLALSESGKRTLAPVLGAKCVALPAIDILLLSVTAAGSEVVTLATKDCPVARFTLTAAMGKLTSASGPADAAPGPAASTAAADHPIVWTQLRPDTDSARGQLIVRAIVARDAPCPALTVKDAAWPMETRTDGSDPDFPIKMCEAALPGNAAAQIGDVALKPRPDAPRRIVVIGDTGCRITDYAAQACDRPVDWPFFRVAEAASAQKPDLVIHVGDYHYREKPCAGRTGCAGSPYGDTWAAWQADFFAPATPLLNAAPWVMVRGNHEDCTRAGAGWNLLIRPTLGLKAGERCPPDTDPDLFAFAHLLFAVPDTASAGLDYRPEDRAVTYRNQIRALSRNLAAASSEIWLLTHQALWVSYGQDRKTKRYDAEELLGRIPDTFDADLRADVCGKIIDPVDTYRQWLDGVVPKENPNRPSNETPCREAKLPPGDALAPPGISLIVSGHTHNFQMFAPAEGGKPLQLIVGNGGDALESVQSFPEASKALDFTDATLFGVAGKLWMRNTFGFAVLEKSGSAWTATLHDVDGKPIARCGLERPGASCKPL
jgi:calcineurin-like phosphoesterase family protein